MTGVMFIVTYKYMILLQHASAVVNYVETFNP